MHGLTRTLLVAAALAALCATPASAEEPGVWGEISVPVVRSERWLWMASTEMHSEERLPRSTFIGRGASSARFLVGKGWSLRAGYWSRLRGHGSTVVGWQHGISGGVSYPLPWTRAVGVGTTLYEHQFLPGGLAERNRLRQRLEFLWDTGTVSPWAGEELILQDGRGALRARTRVGLAFTIPRGWELRAGYQYVAVKTTTNAWAPQHAILLQLRSPALFDVRHKKKKKTEPEPEQQLEDLQQ
jgi:hypothetical protein